VIRTTKPANSYFWQYVPKPNYVGKDKVVFQIQAGTRSFKIIVDLLVHEVVDEDAKPRVCEKYFKKNAKTVALSLYPTSYAQDWILSFQQPRVRIAGVTSTR
jgi:hypothetical protein